MIYRRINPRFKLPRELYLSGLCKGNDITLRLTLNDLNFGCIHGSAGELSGITSAYDKNINTADWTGTYMSQTPAVSIGITKDSTKSGIIVDRTNSKYLNFFVN